MAMAEATIQQITTDGLKPAWSDANADGIQFINDGEKTWLEVKNDALAAITVTIKTNFTKGGLTLPDKTVSVPAGEERRIGIFDSEIYSQSTGKVQVLFSSAASVKYAVYKHA